MKKINPGKTIEIVDEDGYGYYEPPLYPMPVSYGASRTPYGGNNNKDDQTPENIYPKTKNLTQKGKGSKSGDKRVRKQLMKQNKKSKGK